MSGRQPGAVPSIRRITTPSGRRVVLSVTSGKRRSDSATYAARLIHTGERVSIKRHGSGDWHMAVYRATHNSADTGLPVRTWVPVGAFSTLALAAERVQ